MTYSKESQSAMDEQGSDVEMPAWIKLMRGLVIALLCASIFAMIAVGYAAVRLIGEAANSQNPQLAPKTLQEISQKISLPDGAEPLSLSQQKNGDVIVIYEMQGQDRGQYGARIIDETGEIVSEAEFQ